MDKHVYNQLEHAKIVTHMEAYRFITDNWHVSTWQQIPRMYTIILGLNPSLGMCNGMLMSRQAALGLIECVNMLNRPRTPIKAVN